MRNLISSLLFASWLLLSGSPVIVCAATVGKIDDTVVTGDLIKLADGVLVISVTAPPSTRAATTATSRPSTQPVPQTVSIQLSEIAYVTVREPTPKSPAVQARVADADLNQSQNAVSSALHALFGSNSNTFRRRSKANPANQVAAQDAKAEADNVAHGKGPATTRSTVTQQWQAKLANGDSFVGRIDRWADRRVTFQLAAIADGKFELPADQISELWCTDSVAVAKARALTRELSPEDVAFVRKDSDVIAVKGLAVGIETDSLLFRFDDQDRKIALTKLVGIVRGTVDAPTQAPKFHQKIKLASGDGISGTWTAMTPEFITVQTIGGAPVRLPLNKINSIDFVGGRLVYLSDLKPDKVEQTPYFGRVMPWRANKSLDGGPLRLSDGQYAKGIAMHSKCVLEYDIQQGFERFAVKVGFEQPEGNAGSAVLRVLGDQKVLYENTDARGDQPPIPLDLNVNGLQHLTIEVDFGKTPEVAARVIWANARLLRTKIPE